MEVPVPKRPPIAPISYLYLRLGMAGVLVTLAVSVLVEVVRSDGCWQRSISAYYYTPTRTVFVGALLALALGMIVLLGSTALEDVGLNLAGLFAPLVAFVPTRDFNNCSLVTAAGATTEGGEPRQVQEAAADAAVAAADAAVRNNVTTYLLVALIALLLLGARRLYLRSTGAPGWQRRYVIAYASAAVVLAATATWFLAEYDQFYRRAHMTAAVLLFVCIIAVVFSNAYDRNVAPDEALSPRAALTALPGRLGPIGRDRYGVLAWAMVLVVAVVLLWDWKVSPWAHKVLVIEAALIALFAVFWVMQTFELRHEVLGLRRSAPAAAEGQPEPDAPQQPPTGTG